MTREIDYKLRLLPDTKWEVNDCVYYPNWESSSAADIEDRQFSTNPGPRRASDHPLYLRSVRCAPALASSWDSLSIAQDANWAKGSIIIN